MNTVSAGPADYKTPPSSLDASDEFADGADAAAHYCPIGLLDTFSLLMAGHGRCISTSMMLGDREYAMWQLARARTIDDPQLGGVTSRLFTYFDSEQGIAHAVRG